MKWWICNQFIRRKFIFQECPLIQGARVVVSQSCANCQKFSQNNPSSNRPDTILPFLAYGSKCLYATRDPNLLVYYWPTGGENYLQKHFNVASSLTKVLDCDYLFSALQNATILGVRLYFQNATILGVCVHNSLLLNFYYQITGPYWRINVHFTPKDPQKAPV